MADGHFTASTSTISGKPEWHVIHSGKELGPFSFDELIGKAASGEIGAGDLAKQTGGLWTQASEFGFLQEQFRVRVSRQEALDTLSRFQGLWLSKRALLVSACILAF